MAKFFRRGGISILTYLAEFSDRRTENEYYLYEITSYKRYFKNVVLALGLVYFLFLIPDFFNIHHPVVLMSILVPKALILVLVTVHFRWMRHHKPSVRIQYYLVLYEAFFIACYLLTVCVYEKPNYLIKCMDMQLILIAFFMVPTKWKYNVATTAAIVVAFFIVSPFVFHDVSSPAFWAGRVYTLIVLALSAIASYRFNCISRRNYFNEKSLEEIAQKDPLTGIYNRARFDKDVAECDQLYREKKIEYSVIMFDFDNFKYVNDTYGHTAGDRMMLDAVDLVKGMIRESDVFVRWGGDEFILLLPGVEKAQACLLAERLRTELSQYKYRGDEVISCSFSVVSAADVSGLQELLVSADALLYQAKADGRNIVRYYAGGTT